LWIGSAGVATGILSYIAPGLVIEALFLIPGAGLRVAPRSGERGFAALAWAVAAGALGNMGGAATNALLFFSLRGDAFTVAVVASLLTGALGGWLAAVVGRRVATVCRRETNAPTREGLAGTERR